MLFAILASSTFWERGKSTRGGLQTSTLFCLANDTGAQDELDLLESDVPQAIMPTKQFFLCFVKVEVPFVDGVHNRNESVGGLERIGCVVRFRSWEIVLRVDVCSDGSSIGVVWNAAERQTIGFDSDRFVGVSLEETRRREESNFDVGNVEGGNFEKSKVSELIMDSPSDFALTFDLETLRNALELRNRSGRRDGTFEVGEVRRDGDAGSRVPNDGARVCLGSEGFPHASGSLKSHSKRRRMARQMNVREDFVGSGTLMKRERSGRERVGRVGGCHRAILRGSWRRPWAFGTPGRTRTLVVSLSLLACGRRQRRRVTGVAKLVCATLKTECAFLESRKVTKVVALSNRWGSRSDISLLSETEGVRTV